MKKLLPHLLFALLVVGCEENSTEPTVKHGCLDSQACNYDADATIDNNSCWYAIIGCECSDGEDCGSGPIEDR